MTEEQVKKLHSPEFHLLKAQELLDSVDAYSILGVNTSEGALLAVSTAAELANAHSTLAQSKVTFRKQQKEGKK